MVMNVPEIPCPAPHRPFERNIEQVEGTYMTFGHGLTLSDIRKRLREHEWEQVRAVFRDGALVEAALRRYTDAYRRLALDVPEFAFWAGQVDHQATREGLAELRRLLGMLASGAALPAQLETVSRLHRVALTRPAAETGHVPAGMELPTLDQAYLAPRYQVAETTASDDPSAESWWEEAEVREDLAGFLAGFLTGRGATERPLVVLGQPGAGTTGCCAPWP